MNLLYSIEVLTGTSGVREGPDRRRHKTVAVRLRRDAAEDRCREASLEFPNEVAYMYGLDGYTVAAYRQGVPLPEDEW